MMHGTVHIKFVY